VKFFRSFVLYFLSILFVYTLIHFLVWKIPGDISDFMSDSETSLIDLKKISGAYLQREKFFSHFFNFITFNWGSSLVYKEKNITVILKHLFPTLYLSLLSILLSLFFVFLMLGQERKKMNFLAKFFISLPPLVVFPVFVWLFCEFTNYCPAGSENFKLMIFFAAFAQALLVAPRFYRELEAEIDYVLRQRFVLILRAKGLTRKRILWMHVLTNVFPPFLSLSLLTWLSFISGSILVEALFDLPGIGALTLEALRARDLPLLYSLLMFLAVLHLSSLKMTSLLRRRVNV
jgi:peptide/nickel transport system permease protein